MTSCPSADTLAKFLPGALVDALAAEIREHVPNCPRCQAVLDQLSDDPQLREWAPSAPAKLSAAVEGPALGRALEELCLTATPHLQADPSLRSRSSPLTFLEPAKDAADLGALGPYAIRAELGRGGMGIVLCAYDATLKRTVALKVLRPELADEQARARFVREAQATARIDHDHVVRIHAVVNPPQSVPYLVMEYVDGPTLAQVLRAAKCLKPRQAVDIVVQAADGLAAAHAAGLIHRDIKPSNILLKRAAVAAGSGLNEGTCERLFNPEPAATAASAFSAESAIVKISDFGLARLHATPSDWTRDGQLAGTPMYMSPEQAEGLDSLDARTDVYSLGVTLYEALTGEVPFRGTPHMVLKQVVDEEARPPRQLNDAIPVDVETICLKALAKEPGRRYQTAGELADDLRRWQRGEPIRARPVHWHEKVWKWARRRPAVASLLLVSVTALVGMLTTLIVSYQRLQVSHSRAELSNQRLQESHQRAEHNLEQALQAVELMLTRVGDQQLLDVPGMEGVRRKLLEDARSLLQEVHRSESGHPAVRLAMGKVYRSVAFLYHQLDVHPDAEESGSQSVAVLERLVAGHPAEASYRFELGKSHRIEALILRRISRFDQAAGTVEENIRLVQPLTTGDPEQANYAEELARAHLIRGWVRKDLGRFSESEADYRQSAALLQPLIDRQPDKSVYRGEWARACHFLGWLKHDLARKPAAKELEKLNQEAEECYRLAVTTREQLVRQAPGTSRYEEDLGDSYTNLANLLTQTDRAEEAEAIHERNIALWQKMVEDFPLRSWYRNRLGNAQNNLVVLYLDQGRNFDFCQELLRSALTHQRAALERNPRNPDTLRYLTNHYGNLARLAVLEDKHQDAAGAAGELARVREVGEDYHRAARYLANCVPLAEKDRLISDGERQRSARAYADQALEMLREANRKGYRNRDDLKKNPAFDPLRSREDFAELVK